MAKRRPLNNHKKNRKSFARTAKKLHPKNVLSKAPMRGGIRL